MARKSSSGVNKSQAIRDYFGAHPDATPKQVVAGLAGQGVTVSPGLVSNVKSTSGLGRTHRKRVKKRTVKKKTARRGRPPGRKAAASSTGLSAQDLFAAKQFADNLGGLAAARKALDALERLR